MLPCLQLWLCLQDHASKAGKSTNSAFDNGSCTEESLFTGRRQYMVLDYTMQVTEETTDQGQYKISSAIFKVHAGIKSCR